MTKFKRSNHRHNLGEGIIWDHHVELILFVDILSMKLFRMHPDSFEIENQYNFDEYVAWVQLTNNKNLYLLGMQSGLAIFNIISSEIKFINKEIPQHSNQRLNDSFVGTNGRLWYGSMEHKSIELYNGVLAYFSSKEGKVKIMDEGYGITNGPIIDKTNNYLYHNDSKKGAVYKYYLDMEKVALKEKNVFLQFNPQSETPDGMCFDNKYNLFIAIWGGGSVNEYDQSGKFTHSFELPEKFITNVCFAGKNLDRIFVTTAKSDSLNIPKQTGGYIYEILDHNSQGLQANEYII
jgi:xylono-1,5-lactonase